MNVKEVEQTVLNSVSSYTEVNFSLGCGPAKNGFRWDIGSCQEWGFSCEGRDAPQLSVSIGLRKVSDIENYCS